MLKPHHHPALDGLRGVAILFVMAFHASARFFGGGFIGVNMFFVLSGFLITWLLVAEYDRSGTISLKRFYMRRMLRLAPALLLLLFVYASSSIWLSRHANENLMAALMSFTYLSNWARAFGWFHLGLLGHTWSLSVEEQFYLLWPILLLVLLQFVRSRLLQGYIALGIAFSSWAWRVFLDFGGYDVGRLYNGSDTRADGLMIGCALGFLVVSDRIRFAPKRLRWLAPAAWAALFWFFATAKWDSAGMMLWGYAVIDGLTAIVILDLLVNPGSLLAPLLKFRWLTWIGSISYGLYLWNYPIYELLVDAGFRGIIVATMGSAAALAIAAVSFYLMERPILSLKQRFSSQPAAMAGPIPASTPASG